MVVGEEEGCVMGQADALRERERESRRGAAQEEDAGRGMASSRDSTSAGAGDGTAKGTCDQGWMVASAMIEVVVHRSAWAKIASQIACLPCPAMLVFLIPSCRHGLMSGRWLLTCGRRVHGSVVCVVRTSAALLRYKERCSEPRPPLATESRMQRPSHSPTCRGLTLRYTLRLLALKEKEMRSAQPLHTKACVCRRLVRHTTVHSACIPPAYSPMSCPWTPAIA